MRIGYIAASLIQHAERLKSFNLPFDIYDLNKQQNIGLQDKKYIR